MSKYILGLMCIILSACGPVTYNLSSANNQGLTESLAIEIKDNTQITVRPGQKIYISIQPRFRKADGRYVNVCRDLQIDSSQSKTDKVSLDEDNDKIALDVQSMTIRLYRESDYLLCGGRTILTVKTRGGVKPDSYPVTALLKIDDNGEKGEQELSFTVLVPENSP